MSKRKRSDRSLKIVAVFYIVFFFIPFVVGWLIFSDLLPYSACNGWDGGVPGGYCDGPVYTGWSQFVFMAGLISPVIALVLLILLIVLGKQARKQAK